MKQVVLQTDFSGDGKEKTGVPQVGGELKQSQILPFGFYHDVEVTLQRFGLPDQADDRAGVDKISVMTGVFGIFGTGNMDFGSFTAPSGEYLRQEGSVIFTPVQDLMMVGGRKPWEWKAPG
jgi:hypothetical protein